MAEAAKIFTGKKEKIYSALDAYPMDSEGRENIRTIVEAFYRSLPPPVHSR